MALLPELTLLTPQATLVTAQRVKEILREMLRSKDFALRNRMEKQINYIKSLPAKQ